MPTGYTAAVADGISFEQFVMRCARAMGACILMRDDPMDAPIPERFEPSDYHTQKLAEANSEMVKLRAMSESETEAAALEAFDAETKSNGEAIARNLEQRRKYEAMLKQVKSWNAPTPDHEGLKKFMVDQLTESIHFDCSIGYYEEHKPKKQTGAEWLSDQAAKAALDIEYHTAEHVKEVELTEDRNNWLSALRGSLTNS